MYTNGNTYMTFKRSWQNNIEHFSQLVTGAVPFHTADAIAAFLSETYIEPTVTIQHSYTVKCNVVKSLPTTVEWKEAYVMDKDTNYILARVKEPKRWEEDEIRKVHTGYWQPLREGSITFRNGRLVLIGLSAISNRHLVLIVVLQSLRRTIFMAFHTSGVGAHMGAYKTLVVIRMRFFWPHMRKEILDWCKSCAQCIPARLQTRVNSGLSHSWPITTPFAFISVDI